MGKREIQEESVWAVIICGIIESAQQLKKMFHRNEYS